MVDVFTDSVRSNSLLLHIALSTIKFQHIFFYLSFKRLAYGENKRKRFKQNSLFTPLQQLEITKTNYCSA